MICTEVEAKTKQCIMARCLYTKLSHPEGDIGGFNRTSENTKCIASECMTAWRWIDDSRGQGYCGLGGKPD